MVSMLKGSHRMRSRETDRERRFFFQLVSTFWPRTDHLLRAFVAPVGNRRRTL